MKTPEHDYDVAFRRNDPTDFQRNTQKADVAFTFKTNVKPPPQNAVPIAGNLPTPLIWITGGFVFDGEVIPEPHIWKTLKPDVAEFVGTVQPMSFAELSPSKKQKKDN